MAGRRARKERKEEARVGGRNKRREGWRKREGNERSRRGEKERGRE